MAGVFNADAFENSVTTDPVSGFPVCMSFPGMKYRLFFKFEDLVLSRKIKTHWSFRECSDRSKILIEKDIIWNNLDDRDFNYIPVDVLQGLMQVEQKGNFLRKEFTAEEYLKNHPIEDYTLELNRELSRKYGQIFSAKVFNAFVQTKKVNKDLLNNILADFKNKNTNTSTPPFKKLKGKIKLVVSFGLGWKEGYGMNVPYYIEDFLNDMKSLGLDVAFMKKNPFGSVEGNIEKLIPELKKALENGEDIIFVSLCKGTPELLAAEAELMRSLDGDSKKSGKILGHINLSGMLTGAIFSDFAEEVIMPKMIAPLMKLVPFAGIRDTGMMVDALSYMKSSVIQDTIQMAQPHLDKNIFYINVTGAPMSTQVLEGDSPMKMVVEYSAKKKFIDGANDGFLELPGTLIPKEISENQATLMLDSTHLLSDGQLHGYRIDDKNTRRSLYFSIVKEILKRDPQYSAGL